MHSLRESLHAALDAGAVVGGTVAAVVVPGVVALIRQGGDAVAHGFVVPDKMMLSAQQPLDASHPPAELVKLQCAQAAGQHAPLVGCATPVLHVGSAPVRACVVRNTQAASTADSFHGRVDSGYAWLRQSKMHARAVVVPLVSTHATPF